MEKFSVQKSLEILQRTPEVLILLLENLSDDWIFSNEGENTWSPYDVIGHLIHGEKTDWIPRLNQILFDDNKHFVPFNRIAQFQDSQGKSLQTLLNTFKELRAKNIQYLLSLNLSEKELHLTGIHPEFGEVTAKQLLATWAVHDLGHIAQISRVMAKQYKDEVGPWTAYISILNT